MLHGHQHRASHYINDAPCCMAIKDQAQMPWRSTCYANVLMTQLPVLYRSLKLQWPFPISRSFNVTETRTAPVQEAPLQAWATGGHTGSNLHIWPCVQNAWLQGPVVPPQKFGIDPVEDILRILHHWVWCEELHQDVI